MKPGGVPLLISMYYIVIYILQIINTGMERPLHNLILAVLFFSWGCSLDEEGSKVINEVEGKDELVS